MELYIDFENIRSLIESRDHVRYIDCIKTLQKQLDVFFNFKKDELTGDEGVTAWFMQFTQGVGEKNKHKFIEEKFPTRPLKTNTHISFSHIQLSSVFLVDDEKIDSCKQTGAILIGKPGDEIHVISKLFLNQEDYSFDKKFRIGGNELGKWSDLDNYAFPVSDIVIIDGFIASDISLISSNLISLLKTLVQKSKCKVNIVLYTNKEQVNISYDDLSSNIRKAIKSITGIKPNFTLVKYTDRRGQPSFAEHDRTILTNYNRLYSGDTFNYFDTNGKKITKGREMHMSNLANRESHELALELIKDIQDNILKLPNENIQGDNKSNFFSFC